MTWRLAMMMSHALRGEIALMHALCAILAGCATVLVDAFGLALAAADTSASGPEGSSAHSAGGHGAIAESDATAKKIIMNQLATGVAIVGCRAMRFHAAVGGCGCGQLSLFLW